MAKKRCRKSGKVKFYTEVQVKKRACELMAKPDCKVTLYTYRCPHCDHYHLTSEPQRNKK